MVSEPTPTQQDDVWVPHGDTWPLMGTKSPKDVGKVRENQILNKSTLRR